MDMKTRIDQAVKDAMRSHDDATRRTLRLVLAAIKQSEVDQRIDLDDTAVFAILQKEVKTRHESLEDARKANRPDLIDELDAEMAVLRKFLPEEITDEALLEMAKAVIAEVGATSPADMGKVMKELIPRVQGKAPGNRISQAVRSLLQN
ncbi:MAG TPA: GatB/YqeY domain-containing protein [Anaerolineales bacterium]|nr:GatB/YqeY domain-containing protein [Anaerolineales bacterium]